MLRIQRVTQLFREIENTFQVHVRHKGGTSSNMWLERQRRDPYVKRADKETYRARSAFKLIEIDQKLNFLNAGDIVIDIGACPGSWSQVAVQKTNSNGASIQSVLILTANQQFSTQTSRLLENIYN